MYVVPAVAFETSMPVTDALAAVVVSALPASSEFAPPVFWLVLSAPVSSDWPLNCVRLAMLLMFVYRA